MNDTDAESDVGSAVEAETVTDGQVLLDALFEEGVLTTDERTGEIVTSAAFEDTYSIYLDTYTSVSESEFVATVAEVFGFDSATAADRIDELGVTREQLAAYLSLRSASEGTYDTATASRMAVVVADLEPETPVPGALPLVDDGNYEEFLATNDRAIVTVWKRRCDPCEAMKGDLDAILDVVPEDVPVAGIDGEKAPAFRREYGIESAPAMVMFENGQFREGFSGRATPERVATAIASVYES